MFQFHNSMNKLAILLLLFSGVCSATITAVGGTTAGPTSSSPMTFTYSPTPGNQMVAALPIASNGTYPYCADNNLQTVFPGPKVTDGSTQSLATFTSIAASSATSYVCRWFSASNTTGMLEEFSGVQSVNPGLSTGCAGSLPGTCSGTGGSPSFSVTTEDNNDVVVCVLSNTTGTWSGNSGTLLQSVSSQPKTIMFTVTSASPGSVTCSATLTGGTLAWVGAAIELRTVTTSPTWKPVQITPSGYPQIGFGCPRGSGVNNALTCTFSVATVGSSHPLVLVMDDHKDVGSGVEVSITAVSDCASLTAGACASSINSWIGYGGSCNAVGFAAGAPLYTDSVDCAYVLSSASGANYITVTRSSNINNEPFSLVLIELSATGSAAVDNINAVGDNSVVTTHTMTGTSLVGSSDVIVQGFSGGANQSVTSPYLLSVAYSHFNYALALNTNSGVAPTWIGSTGAPAGGNAIALRLSGGAGSAHCAACDLSLVLPPPFGETK